MYSDHTMQANFRRNWLASVIGLAMLNYAIGAHAATGARVLLQVWSPLTPDQQNVVTLVDQPSLLSDSLQDAWMQARPQICEQLKARMGAGGAAAGQTLRDINCALDEHVALDVVPAGQNALRATFAVSGFVEATSTTPTVLGKYADPRFSLALTAKLALTLAVQPDRNQTLRVSKALFTLNNAVLDSHNFSGDILKFVSDDLIPFFGGPNYKSMAENAVNAVSVDFANAFDAALAPVNAQLKGPSDAVRVGVSASGNYISVAFAPREFVPPIDGRMSGVLRWDSAQFAPRNGCQSFDIRATVQTGPVPMFTPDASAPTRQVGSFQANLVDANRCAFTLSGLAAGWPNVLTTRVDGGATRSAGSSLYSVSYALSGDGWNGRVVVPQPVADARNYVVSRSLDATAVESPGRAYLRRNYRTDPRINPADRYTRDANPVGVRALQARPADATMLQQGDTVSLNPQPLPPQAARRGDTVSLNPQPLPPKAAQPAVQQTQMATPAAGSTAGIIIVSGNPATRRVDQTKLRTADPAAVEESKIAEPQHE